MTIMEFVKKNGKGILFCLMIAVPCQLLGKQFPIVGGAVFAILAGMLITLFVKDKTNLQSGITFVSKKILQWAVILLGFGLNLSVVLQTGKQSLPIIVMTITTSLVIAFVLCKVLRIQGRSQRSSELDLLFVVVLQLQQLLRLLMQMMRRLRRRFPLSFSLMSLLH